MLQPESCLFSPIVSEFLWERAGFEFSLKLFSFAVGQVRPRPAKPCNFPGPRGEAAHTLFGASGETESSKT